MIRGALERRRERELVQQLSTIDQLDDDILPAVLPPLRDYLGTDTVVAYSVALGASGIECDAFLGVGAAAKRIETFFCSTLRTEGTRYYTYDPLHPPRFQRNRVLRLADWPLELRDLVVANHEATWGRFGIHDQMRVLICDGPSCMWWIGTCSDVMLDEDRARRFRRLVPALQRRLVLERRLREGQAARDVLGVALESIGAPAFVLDARGHLRQANSAGRTLLARDRRARLDELADSSTPLYDRFEASSTGVASHVLVVRRDRHPGSASHLTHARTAWSLTTRQFEVLELVAQGLSNRTISARLRCAEHTVELHVSELLRRANVPSRAALIAKLWTLG